MAGRRFEVADETAVLQHWQGGRSRRQLARSFGMGGTGSTGSCGGGGPEAGVTVTGQVEGFPKPWPV
jgi:hypothetical protein